MRVAVAAGADFSGRRANAANPDRDHGVRESHLGEERIAAELLVKRSGSGCHFAFRRWPYRHVPRFKITKMRLEN
jgi:hypothetical protein